MSVYGAITHGGLVEKAARDLLKPWMPAYLAEIERQLDRTPGSLPKPRSWTNMIDVDRWPEDQLPCVVLICPGTYSEPISEGDGEHRVTWELRVATVVSGKPDARERMLDNAKIYAAAVRTCVLQHPSLGGFAQGVSWLGEAYDDIPIDRSRTLASGEVAFAVQVDDVASAFDGPAEPPEDPLEDPGDWPTATEVPVVEVDRTDEP